MPKRVKKRRNTLAKGVASKKKLEYQRKYNATKKEKKRRAQLNKANRKAGTYGNKDKKDVSHTTDGGYVMEGQTGNRSRKRKKTVKKSRKLPKLNKKKKK